MSPWSTSICGAKIPTLIAQLRQEGIPVIMLSGPIEAPAQGLLQGVMMLEKPVREEQIGTLETNCKNTTKVVSV